MRSDEGSYYVIGNVLKQQSGTVWFSLPPFWRMEERRDSTRNTGGFVVNYVGDSANGEVNGVAACMDVSAGGLRKTGASSHPPH